MLLGRKVRGADGAHLAGLDQPVIGLERLFLRRRHVGPVRLVEVDMVGLQPGQRFLDRLDHVARLEADLARRHFRAELGEHQHLGAVAARLHPVAQHRLGLALAIDVGRVDGGKSGIKKGVKDAEGRCLLERPAQHIAAKHQRFKRKIGAAEAALGHGESPGVRQGLTSRTNNAASLAPPGAPDQRRDGNAMPKSAPQRVARCARACLRWINIRIWRLA